MSLYVVQPKLSTSREEKLTSMGLAMLLTAGIIFLLYFIHITVPNPPFEVEQGVVELDFGMVEEVYGQPDMGGPSETPPAPGTPGGDGSSSSQSAGGYGDVVKTDADNADQHLPPISPPSSQNPSADSRTDRLKNIGKRGSGGNNGPNTGVGERGHGKGTTPGNQGNSRDQSKDGTYTVVGFTNYKFSSTVNTVEADGEGSIICRVRIDCAGHVWVEQYGVRGSTYTGTESNMKKIFNDFLKESTFKQVTDKCGEAGTITLHVKRTL